MKSRIYVDAGRKGGKVPVDVVVRLWAGKLMISAAPGPRKKPATSGQQTNENRFRMGTQYAKTILQDPDMAEAYGRVLKPRQNRLSRALQDYFNAPEIKELDISQYTGQKGEIIQVRA